MALLLKLQIDLPASQTGSETATHELMSVQTHKQVFFDTQDDDLRKAYFSELILAVEHAQQTTNEFLTKEIEKVLATQSEVQKAASGAKRQKREDSGEEQCEEESKE